MQFYAIPHVHAAIIHSVVTVYIHYYVILRIGGDFAPTGLSPSIYTSTSLAEFKRGHAELLLLLLATTIFAKRVL